MRRVAGIALSLSATGIVSLDLETGQVVDKRTVRARGKGLERCRWLRDFLIGHLRYQCDGKPAAVSI